MSFTYTAGNSNRDRLRLYIGDTVEDEGPLPEDKNFSDEELDDILTYEGNLCRAQANCLEALAAAWTLFPTFQGDGISISRSHIGRNYSQQAEQLRKRCGYADGMTATARAVIRVDGYSDDIDNFEVDN
jgi:hypothetical protein